MKTNDQEKSKVCSTPDELVASARVAAATGKKFIYATQEVMDSFNVGDSFDFDLMGVKVILEGKLENVNKKYNTSMEEVNHG